MNTTYGKVIAMISERPVTAVQISEALGLSRQRVAQTLWKAEALGEIKRVVTAARERGRYVYLPANAEVAERTPELTDNRRRLLSSMAPNEIYYVTELSAASAAPRTARLRSWVLELTKLGLVYHFSVGVKMFCGISPLGLNYPDYDRSATKAKSVNFVDEFGEIRAKFLQAMRIRGAAKTIELTHAVGSEIFENARYSSSHVIQRLEGSGLVEREMVRKTTRTRARIG